MNSVEVRSRTDFLGRRLVLVLRGVVVEEGVLKSRVDEEEEKDSLLDWMERLDGVGMVLGIVKAMVDVVRDSNVTATVLILTIVLLILLCYSSDSDSLISGKSGLSRVCMIS